MCAGIARRLRVDPVLVRVFTVVLTVVTGGVAALGYGALWVALPEAGDGSPARSRRPRAGRPRRSRRGRLKPRSRAPWAIAVGAGLVALGLLFVFRETGAWWSDTVVWPLLVTGAGGALIWRQFSVRRRERREVNGPGPAGQRVGGLAGVALLLGGALLFLYLNGALDAGGKVALAAITAVVVIGLLATPFWVRSARELSSERTARIRSQERAEVAAHLHDSVLQTLAMIQQHPGDERRVSTLARSQERELREWLSGRTGTDRGMLAEALKATAAEIEQLHQVPIEAVTVGDCPLDERGSALVAATREALLNAVRHGVGEEAGAAVRLYAEIGEGRAQVFVHDRGPGFDPDAIPADRHGVRDSILNRMEHHGGRAEIRSAPGEGTEIELTVEAG